MTLTGDQRRWSAEAGANGVRVDLVFNNLEDWHTSRRLPRYWLKLFKDIFLMSAKERLTRIDERYACQSKLGIDLLSVLFVLFSSSCLSLSECLCFLRHLLGHRPD